HTKFSRDWSSDVCSSDLTFSDVANPAHTYSVSGNIPVQLIVTSDMGCRDTASNLIPLYTSPLTSAWASEPEICIGDHVDLFASRSEERRVGKDGWTRWPH